MFFFTCRLASLPEKPATIDWSHYRGVVAKAGMVDEFEKKVRCGDFSWLGFWLQHVLLCSLYVCLAFHLQFSALKIPEPVDTQTAKVDVQEQEAVSVFVFEYLKNLFLRSCFCLCINVIQSANGSWCFFLWINQSTV